MTTYLILAVGCIVSAIIFFIIGRKSTNSNDLSNKNKQLEQQATRQAEEIKQLTSQRDVANNTNSMLKTTIDQLKAEHQKRLDEALNSHNAQLQQVKLDHDKEIFFLKETYDKQLADQLTLIGEQIKTTSETVLKARQNELGERNREQVSKIIDPLQKSLKDMEQALTLTKEQQRDALARLDETIKLSMAKTVSLGETADRLTRALTGEVKVQGNFGELKLKQLLEDLELKEGEQFDTQQTLRDKFGKALKDDEGKGLIPDFILHFPDNRHVVVDAKMSLTDYERYMNAGDNTAEKSATLKAHIDSVRAQAKRLSRKDYTRYLPKDCNRLSFVIMYIPIEGAFNLAMLNDPPLWREAYDQGVLILGPHTMYMNLRVLEMMWRQVRQLKNQQTMIDAANTVIERVQDFALRFADVESSLNDTVKKMNSFKITTSDSGRSIITAARQLIKAGANENKKKKSLNDTAETLFGENILPEE
ncbi:MAG: DNA recombination protein RmuC [Bacteroidaceae bacterium]